MNGFLIFNIGENRQIIVYILLIYRFICYVVYLVLKRYLWLFRSRSWKYSKKVIANVVLKIQTKVTTVIIIIIESSFNLYTPKISLI